MHLAGTRLWAARIGVIAAIAVAIVAIELTIAPERGGASSGGAGAPALTAEPGRSAASLKGPAAPEIRSIAAWINTPPLTLEGLRGKVVLVDFWAYSCVNCIRTVPYLQDWNAKYASRGLVIIGLHAPEFDFERSEANVRAAVVKQGITWPVGLDNDFATWNAYRNRYWPRKYLIDRDGAIRYDRIGEGAYIETETQIRKLLAEIGAGVDDLPLGGVAARQNSGERITRELYAGYGWANGSYLGNPVSGGNDRPAQYAASGERADGRLYLHGAWQVGNESVRHAAATAGFEDAVGIRFTAASVNAVIRPGAPGRFDVLAAIDGAPIPEALRGGDIKVDGEGRTYFTVDEPRLYNVVRGDAVVTRNLDLRVNSADFVLYTFTFGS